MESGERLGRILIFKYEALALELLLRYRFLRSPNVKLASTSRFLRLSSKVVVNYSVVLFQLAQFFINDYNHTESYKHGKIYLDVELRLFKLVIFAQ